MSLVHDRYPIAMKTEEGERKVGRVPKCMSKFTYYFIRHGGVRGKVKNQKQVKLKKFKNLLELNLQFLE